MEGHLRRIFPDQWESKKWLGDTIAAVREAEEGTVLLGYQQHVEELSLLNDYCNAMALEEAKTYIKHAIAFAQRRPEPS